MHSSRVVFLATLLAGAVACDDQKAVTQSQDPSTCSCPLSIQVDNLAICAAQSTLTAPPRVYSSAQTAGQATCEDDDGKFPHRVPTAPWSKVRISSPCNGKGKMCFSLRHGTADQPKESDCVLAQECVEFDYETSDGGTFEIPEMPGWTVTDQACAFKYEREGGYIEFHAEEAEVGCNSGLEGSLRTQTCPVHCAQQPDGPGCDACSNEPIRDDL